MSMVAIQMAMMQHLRAKIAEHEQTLTKDVSVGGAAEVIAAILDMVRAVGSAGLKAWLEAGDASADLLEHDGQMLRLKCASSKEFLTPLGPVEVSRRLYQAD